VATWIVWRADLAPDLSVARFASRETRSIAPYSDLAALRKSTTEETQASTGGNILADVVGFNPTEWTLLRFRLWREPPAALADDAQLYKIGHLSLP
jgi:hypothetical protein